MSGRSRGAAGWLERTLAAPALVQALAVATRLGIFDLVSDQPRSALLLAATAGVHPEGLARLLRALAAEGVLSPTEDGRFGPTPVAELLSRREPANYRERLLALANRDWDGWSGLLRAVETGRAPVVRPPPGGFAPPPAAAEALRREVGGEAPGLLFGSEPYLAWAEGVLRPPAPGAPLAVGGGLSLLDEPAAGQALARVHGALPPGGRVLLFEPLLPGDGCVEPAIARADLALLAFGAGYIRTIDDWRRALDRAGLRFDREVPVRAAGGWRLMVASRGLF